MSPREEAETFYRPDEDPTTEKQASQFEGMRTPLLDAERVLMPLEGVLGVGQTVSRSGEATILVYVDSPETLNRLPATAGGMPVVGEITGEIGTL